MTRHAAHAHSTFVAIKAGRVDERTDRIGEGGERVGRDRNLHFRRECKENAKAGRSLRGGGRRRGRERKGKIQHVR